MRESCASRRVGSGRALVRSFLRSFVRSFVRLSVPRSIVDDGCSLSLGTHAALVIALAPRKLSFHPGASSVSSKEDARRREEEE